MTDALAQPARAYHPIVDDDPTIAAPHGHTIQIASTNEVGEPVAIDRAGGAVKLGSVEVREPDLDPGRGVIGCAKAKAVAVSDVADHARERLTGAGRQRMNGRRVGDLLRQAGGREGGN